MCRREQAPPSSPRPRGARADATGRAGAAPRRLRHGGMSVTNLQEQKTGDHRFLLGLLAGGVIGAGLGMFFAPRAARELRARLSGSAKSLGKAASERYDQVSARVGAVAQDYTTRGQALRDGL